MAVDNYIGDSPGKKIARFGFWWKCKSILGAKFYSRDHIVIASREGGDISVLKGLGIDPKHIVAVDTCDSAVKECQAKHPDVNVENIDVLEAVKRKPWNVGTVFLDLCTNLNGNTAFELFENTCSIVADRAIVGINILRGRETYLDQIKSDIEDDVNSKLSSLLEISSSVYEKYKDKDMEALKTGIDQSRISFLLNKTSDKILKNDRYPFFRYLFNYHSCNHRSLGSPMTTGLFQIAVKELGLTTSEFVCEANSQLMMMHDIYKLSNIDFGSRSEYTLVRESRHIKELGFSNKDIALLLNIPIDDVNSWVSR